MKSKPPVRLTVAEIPSVLLGPEIEQEGEPVGGWPLCATCGLYARWKGAHGGCERRGGSLVVEVTAQSLAVIA